MQVVFPIEPQLPDSEMTHEMLAAGIQGMPASIVVPAVEQLIAADGGAAAVMLRDHVPQPLGAIPIGGISPHLRGAYAAVVLFA